MAINRRKFLTTSALAGGAAGILPIRSMNLNPAGNKDYSKLDKILEEPVLRRELFPDPIIIESLELLRDRNNFICRVRSKHGAEGISVGHPFISRDSYPMFNNFLKRQFLGKDARDLDYLIYIAAERMVKRQGNPLSVQIATIEFAILDMLGTIVNLPAGQLLGRVLNPEIGIYLGTRINELRKKEPEESLELMAQDVRETDAKAIKLRAGRGDSLATDIDNAPGRTEKLIRMAREKFGDEMVLMIDGNGSYSVKEAIRIGKILEEYNYYFYEEPVPWDWYEEQKQVEEALNIAMAGGEEEYSLHAFRWLLGNKVFQIIQPDLFYNGGMIRSMKVARMADAMGIQTSPHISMGGLGYLYLLHMVSVCPNAAEYHEFKMFSTRDANGTNIPIEGKGDDFRSADGLINAPNGSGLGITIDPDYIEMHKIIS
jgi:L-alanine-DL-glutamate epimerase-like enolase superfamily enzyme